MFEPPVLASDRAQGGIEISTILERPLTEEDRRLGRVVAANLIMIWCDWKTDEFRSPVDGEIIDRANSWSCDLNQSDVGLLGEDLGGFVRRTQRVSINSVPAGDRRETTWNVRLGAKELIIDYAPFRVVVRCPRPLTDLKFSATTAPTDGCEVTRINSNRPDRIERGTCGGEFQLPRLRITD